MSKITWFDQTYVLNQSNFESLRLLPGIKEFITAFGKSDLGPDRTGTVALPLDFHVVNTLLPLRSNTATYADCCDLRAMGLVQQAEYTDKQLYIMWSGGVDSTTMMTAFLRNTTDQQKQRITVMMSQNTTKENPGFFKRFVLGKLRYETSLNFVDRFSQDDSIFVHGECNGQLFGDMDEFSNPYFMNKPAIDVPQWQHHLEDKATPELISAMWGHKSFNPKLIEIAKHVVDTSARSVGLELQNLHQFACWYKLCFVVQHCQLRPIALLNHNVKTRHQSLTQKVQSFYVSDDFDQWAMQRLTTLGEHCKIQRLESREYIRSFDGDQDYFENMQKVNSGSSLHNLNHRAYALDINMNSVSDEDLINYYQPANIFA
jgi:hypothetical protein